VLSKPCPTINQIHHKNNFIMKPDYSKRLILIFFLAAVLSALCSMFSNSKQDQQPPPTAQEQVLRTTYQMPVNTAPILYADATMVDCGEMTKQGIGTLVIIAVMLLVVSPLVKQMVESNNKLADALGGLTSVISNGNTQILNRILESEKVLREDLEERLCNMQQQIISALKPNT
jgi:hypothetical protein